MEPATSIIEKCGGHKAVAEICGVSLTSVYRWTYESGTRGEIPAKSRNKILAAAATGRVKVKPIDFFAAA